MADICEPAYEPTDSYSKEKSVFTPKDSHTRTTGIFSRVSSVFSKKCYGLVEKIFQNGDACVMQNGDTYIFNSS